MRDKELKNIQKRKTLLTLLRINICWIFILVLISNVAKADFIVKVDEGYNLRKTLEVLVARDSKQNIFHGFISISRDLAVDGKKITITWTEMLTPSSTVALEGLTSEFTYKEYIIPVGKAILVKGSYPLAGIDDEDKKKDKKEERRQIPSASNMGSTTNIASPMTSPVNNNNNNSIFTPTVMSTYDGCNHLYDKSKETITIYERSYYYDKQGKEVEVKACHPIKNVPVKKRACDNFDDFEHKLTYERYQPFFTVKGSSGTEGEEYSAGGCIPFRQYPHMIDLEACPAVKIGDTYVKQGRWFYLDYLAKKHFLTECVLDPENKHKDLKIQYEGCPVTHDVDHNQSVALGKYYLVRPDGKKEYLTECMLTKASHFTHQLEWVDEKWQHHNDDWYSQRIMRRFIYIEPEKRKIVVVENELDPVHCKQIEEQVGWENHDEMDHNRSGYALKVMRRYVKFEDKKYYTGIEYNGDRVDYKVLERIKTGFREGDRNGLFGHHDFFSQYINKVQRPDGSIYTTDMWEEKEQ